MSVRVTPAASPGSQTPSEAKALPSELFISRCRKAQGLALLVILAGGALIACHLLGVGGIGENLFWTGVGLIAAGVVTLVLLQWVVSLKNRVPIKKVAGAKAKRSKTETGGSTRSDRSAASSARVEPRERVKPASSPKSERSTVSPRRGSREPAPSSVGVEPRERVKPASSPKSERPTASPRRGSGEPAPSSVRVEPRELVKPASSPKSERPTASPRRGSGEPAPSSVRVEPRELVKPASSPKSERSTVSPRRGSGEPAPSSVQAEPSSPPRAKREEESEPQCFMRADLAGKKQMLAQKGSDQQRSLVVEWLQSVQPDHPEVVHILHSLYEAYAIGLLQFSEALSESGKQAVVRHPRAVIHFFQKVPDVRNGLVRLNPAAFIEVLDRPADVDLCAQAIDMLYDECCKLPRWQQRGPCTNTFLDMGSNWALCFKRFDALQRFERSGRTSGLKKALIERLNEDELVKLLERDGIDHQLASELLEHLFGKDDYASFSKRLKEPGRDRLLRLSIHQAPAFAFWCRGLGAGGAASIRLAGVGVAIFDQLDAASRKNLIDRAASNGMGSWHFPATSWVPQLAVRWLDICKPSDDEAFELFKRGSYLWGDYWNNYNELMQTCKQQRNKELPAIFAKRPALVARLKL